MLCVYNTNNCIKIGLKYTNYLKTISFKWNHVSYTYTIYDQKNNNKMTKNKQTLFKRQTLGFATRQLD